MVTQNAINLNIEVGNFGSEYVFPPFSGSLILSSYGSFDTNVFSPGSYIGSFGSFAVRMIAGSFIGAYGSSSGSIIAAYGVIPNLLPQGVLPYGSLTAAIPQGQLISGSLPTNPVITGSYTGLGFSAYGSFNGSFGSFAIRATAGSLVTTYGSSSGSIIAAFGVIPNLLPQGVLPYGSLTAALPQGVLPYGSLTAAIPQGQLISGSLPTNPVITGSYTGLQFNSYGSFNGSFGSFAVRAFAGSLVGTYGSVWGSMTAGSYYGYGGTLSGITSGSTIYDYTERRIEGEVYTTTLMYHRVMNPGSVVEARATLGALPTGSNFLLDVRKNYNITGSSIFTSDTPITIATTDSAVNSVYSGSGVLDTSMTPVVAGDVLYFTITQVGSPITGADLLYQMKIKLV